MKKPWSWWVYYLSHDQQGGYWPISPEGPFTNLSAARWAKYKIEHPISPISHKRRASSLVRDVHIRLRLEIRLPQFIQKSSVQKLNTHEKENRHAM